LDINGRIPGPFDLLPIVAQCMPTEPKIAPEPGDDSTRHVDTVALSTKLVKKRRLKSLVQAIIAIVVLIGLGLAVDRSIHHWNEQPEDSRLRLADLRPSWLLLGAALYAAGLMPAVWVLSRTLASLGIKPTLKTVFASQMNGHLAKYVPGKAMVIIVRAAILNRGGAAVSIRAATIAVSIETMTMMATGAAIAMIMLMIVDDSVWAIPRWIRQASILLAIAAAVATLPPVLRFILSRRLIGGALPFRWTTTDVMATGLQNLVGWLLVGASTTAIVFAVPDHARVGVTPPALSLFATCLAAVSISHIAGFLSLLPGGAGVRELVLTTLLAPVAGASGAFMIAIMLRLTQIIVECILAGFSFAILPALSTPPADVDANGATD